MDSASLDQTQLDRIAEKFSGAIRRGENPSIETFLSLHPDPSGQLRSLLASIAMLEGLKRDTTDLSTPRESALLKIDQLDDYTIVREIGRGGMGVVFEAIHQSLGRRVAVKVLASGLLGDPKHLTRFRREARAAARLRHSNIVPVFGVGQTNDHHYYVMDFIDGMSLRQWLGSVSGKGGNELPTRSIALSDTDGETILETTSTQSEPTTSPDADLLRVPDRIDTPDYFRWAAQLVMTVCDALQYAHSQNILHRDIKPANLLVDLRGAVWIADFGLAKLTEQQGVTMTGDIVGTPQYMAPESFEGRYDVKSEVYCVGLTLYELLTLRPAIDGKSPGDVIRKATEGVSLAPRKLNQHVPRDLETIALKSLAHDPRARYVTAGELRDDLQRFLTDCPIAARRTNLAERAIRWSRREPTVAILTFATFALLFALAAVSAVGYSRTKDALDATRSAKRSAEASLEQRTATLKVADEQRARAEKNLQVAIAAFDSVMQNITERGIETDAEYLGEVTDTTSPNVTPEDAKLLQSLLGFFDQLAANNSEDLLAESAIAARRAGDIYLRLGQLTQADRAYSDALARHRQLAQREPNDLASIVSQAEIMNKLAVIAGLRGQLGRANQMFAQTRAALKESEAAMASQAGSFQYARALRLFASLGARTGLDGMTRRPQPIKDRQPRRPIGQMLKIRANMELTAITEAISRLESLVEESPDEVRYRAELARAYRDKAKLASRAHLKGKSEDAIRQSIDLFEKLLANNQDSKAIRYELALTLSSTEARGFNQMLRAIHASELSAALLADSPTQPRYQALRAHTLETLASHQQRIGKLDAAEKSLMQALRIYHSLFADSPELSLYETRRSQALESMADVKLRQGISDAAIEYLERAIRGLQPGMRRPNVSPVARIQLQRMRQKLARMKDKP